MNLLILTSAFAGFGALCLGMERHAKQVFASLPNRFYRVLAATAGWSLLIFSLVQSVRNYGISIGIAAWFGFLTLAATALALLLAYAPGPVRYLAPGALLLGTMVAWLL